MINLVFNKNDYRYVFVVDDGATKDIHKRQRVVDSFGKVHIEDRVEKVREIVLLEEYLNKTPSYMFLPSFRGIPRPEVFLDKIKINGKVVYYIQSGLWKNVKDWCDKMNIQCNDMPNEFKYTSFGLTKEQFKQYISQWGLNLNPRDYQIDAAWIILKYRMSLSQLATRAGKTLIAYIVFRYMLENGAHNILMVVPSISLVKQGVEDMSEYKEFFHSETVWAKGEYAASSNLTIGTFQSLVKKCTKLAGGRKNPKYDPKFFDKFDVVCIDECHKASCKSIKDILNQPFMKYIKLKFGFSGTLPDDDTIESYAVQSLLGPCIQDISSRELIDSGFLAEPNITQVRIHHEDNKTLLQEYIKCGEYLCSYFDEDENGSKIMLPKEQRDMTMVYQKKLPTTLQLARNQYDAEKYREILIDLCKDNGANLLNLEQMIAEHSTRKLDVIYKILFANDTNGIVFAHNTAYLDYLYKHFKDMFPLRPCYLIKGTTTTKKREEIKRKMNEEDKDAILFASYGCVGTGLTFKNIDYCIFTQSFKSKIINLQSIGRGLLLKEGKSEFLVYDIIDCFPTERLKRHGDAKIKTYKQSGFKYKIVKE